MSEDTARIRDQLGRNPETFPILNADYSEDVIIEEGPVIITENTREHSWIVGSSTNGLVGPNTGTLDGEQQIVGPEPIGVVNTVINPDNVYKENFDFDDFEDPSTTATGWGTGTLSFTVGQIAKSLSVYLDIPSITQATLSVSDDTNLTLELSADGGSNWETVTNDTLYSFTNTGNDLRFRFTATGVASITECKIQYN